MPTLTHRQRGFTLLELLIGLSIGAFLLGSSVYMYAVFVKSSFDLLAATRLDHELRAAMTLMVDDIRRAGYSAATLANIKSGVNNNPFMANGGDITVPVNSCVLFSYDKNSDGTLPALNAASSDERFGYRLSGSTLQTRAETDATFNCNTGTWHDLTNTNLVEITNLTYTLTPTVISLDNGTSTLVMRNVNISLSGRLSNDTAVSRTLTEAVKVRNDKYQP